MKTTPQKKKSDRNQPKPGFSPKPAKKAKLAAEDVPSPSPSWSPGTPTGSISRRPKLKSKKPKTKPKNPGAKAKPAKKRQA